MAASAGTVAGTRPRRGRHPSAAALLAGGLACLALAGAASAARAHDAPANIVPEDRVELSFGRTEDYDYDPPQPGSYRLPSLGAAADGTLLDPRGRELTLHGAMDGHITVLAFVYTRCTDPQGCPLALALLHDLEYVAEQDPVIGEALRLITVSFDTEYDTPEVMGEYAATVSEAGPGSSDWLFLTARTREELRPVLAAYDQPIGRKSDAEDPFGPFTHQLRVYLVDRALRIRNIYSLGFLDPRLVIADVRTLLLEESDGSRGM